MGLVKAATTTVLLGTADSFAVLGGAGVTNTGATTIVGDVGTFPTTSETGFGSITLTGTNHMGDGVTQGAKTDLVTAYNDIAGRTPTDTFVAADNQLGGKTLTSGTYAFGHASTANLIGTLTLDGEGQADAVFIFQASSDFVTASSSSVQFINGAQACNVFWQVTSSTTLGTSTAFKGTVISLTSSTLANGATVVGRVLARNGTVTLDNNVITRPSCTTATELPKTNGAEISKQSFPWNAVIMVLAGISTAFAMISVNRSKKLS
jgi:hypothetical protein